ncbi:hypothetical protein EPA93_08670 [Ktedonosporobacter rubrisoli]|uniref:Selenoprotein B glycine/betaine/sarcosine/D-proline reductase n=1 Tax=Ktedonosporobacter rubrisoli TaxID=2509675 RepID=A0A4P6JLK1_KTERU|nr:glycine/sarcosine/betaine reductase selenoprotein B family protein [Ktedonosporobacter rubrisoli]QBD76075.1 hypothetical protein EPA93_08670 [Ktedonosporobacter rubrisoli]
MEGKPHLTPVKNWREHMLRWANDSARGQRIVRWLGGHVAVWQFRLLASLPDEQPWSPLSRPLSAATVALVTTSGVHLCADKPFHLDSDTSFRFVPRTARLDELCISHENYDRRDAQKDLNLIFPLERLLELEEAGVIGRVAEMNFSMGFTKNPQKVREPGRKIAAQLVRQHVDLALLVPA